MPANTLPTPRDVLVIMDPISKIKITKDTTFAIMLEAQRREYRVHYVPHGALILVNGEVFARASRVIVRDDPNDSFTLSDAVNIKIGKEHLVFMRKDPPVDAEYLYATHLLNIAERQGARVINSPNGLRDLNEKLAAQLFPDCCPPTCVSCDISELKTFISTLEQVVIKPLDGMGGSRIFRSSRDDTNLHVILETLTQHGRNLVMVQRFLPEIAQGDKRILLINGTPVPYCLARIPQGNEFRGNLAAGGQGIARALSLRDQSIAQRVGPEMRRRGMMFVGIDVIGDYLTEINVTSPTCMREIDAQCHTTIAAQLFEAIETEM